jgi:hypothetical protein
MTLIQEVRKEAIKAGFVARTACHKSRSFAARAPTSQRCEQGRLPGSLTSAREYIKENLVGGKANARIVDPSKHASNLEFETKFKQIPDKLHTQQAREIARERLEYMKQFFERLKREIDGQL